MELEEGVEFPLPKSIDPTFLYANKKGDTLFIQKLKSNGFELASDDFSLDVKNEREAVSFLKKHQWHFTGVE